MAADLTLDSAHETKTLSLANTVKVIEITRDALTKMQGLYVYCTAVAYYQLLANGTALTSGTTAPTSDEMPIPLSTHYPIGIPAHVDGLNSKKSLQIAVWAASGTPTLHIAPFPKN